MQMTPTLLKPAFSLLELIFVIAILGIIASIGSSMIVEVYESYIVERALYRASTKAELAAMQISNRLTYRISSGIIGKKTSGVYAPLDEILTDDYTTLEWIAYDSDSFGTQATPGWSGYCDLNTTTRTSLNSPGSDLSTTNTIIGHLSNYTKGVANSAIIFAGHEYNATRNYNPRCMGFTNHTCISPVSGVSGSALTLEDNNPKVMTDQYKLVWSAYALVPSGNQLLLYYNYQPWDGQNYLNGNKRVLVDNFVSFRFRGSGDSIRFKLCVQEPIGDENVTICKEKAVIR